MDLVVNENLNLTSEGKLNYIIDLIPTFLFFKKLILERIDELYLENPSILEKKKPSKGILRTLVGGYFFGTTGAIAGAFSANVKNQKIEKENQEIDKLNKLHEDLSQLPYVGPYYQLLEEVLGTIDEIKNYEVLFSKNGNKFLKSEQHIFNEFYDEVIQLHKKLNTYYTN